jgi:hypothetical protein
MLNQQLSYRAKEAYIKRGVGTRVTVQYTSLADALEYGIANEVLHSSYSNSILTLDETIGYEYG